MTEYRASFDAAVKFSNGGDLTAHGFRVDVPSPEVDEDDIAALFVASLGFGALAALDVAGRAVLLHTGDDARFGSPAYAEGRHFLTRAGATWLADHDAALVGIDALNIDDAADRQRPAHTLLLGAGIPVVEHLTGLEQLPPTGAWFTAAPLRIEKLGTIPVRAFARLPG
jgi:kynurenine formamidase